MLLNFELNAHHLLHKSVCHLHCADQNEHVENQLADVAPHHRSRSCIRIDNRRAGGKHREDDAGQDDDCTLQAYRRIAFHEALADVGTGAGFPGVVLKIARPDIKLTLIDSLNKRLVFLGEVCAQLGIEAELIHSRAEDGARDEKLRESFDFAVSRAVARMNVLSEYCLPYVKVGGAFCAMKGAQANEEFKESLNAINTLGGKLENKYFFELPENGGERAIAVVRKVKNTPQKYPRQSGKIKAKAL